MSDLDSMMVRDAYGNEESNPITDEVKAIREAIEQTVELSDARLVKITRLRLVTDPGFPMYDLSYCYGELRSGEPVRVNLPEWQFSKRTLKRDLIEMCRAAGVYGKGMGILDPSVISILR